MTTQEIVDNILEHHGVLGMKWGRRSGSTSTSESSGPSRKVRRADKKFEKKASSLDTKIKVNNAVAKPMQGHIDRINAKFDKKYKKQIDDGVLFNSDSPITKAYLKEYNDAAMTELNKVTASMTNKSGTRTYKAVRNPDDLLGFTIITKEIKHANDSESIRFVYVKDDTGRIIGFVPENDSVTQSSMVNDVVSDILEHHGIKGMKWGVRSHNTVSEATSSHSPGRSQHPVNSKAHPVTTKSNHGPVPVKVHSKGKKIKTSGGQHHPAHPDAVPAREIGQKAKKSGIHSLSNHELQQYAHRIQLEQNVSRLQFNQKSRTGKFVDNFLGRQGSQLANTAAKQGATRGGKAALNAATRKSIKVARIASLA